MRLQELFKTWRISGTTILAELFGGLIGDTMQTNIVRPTYGVAVAIDCALGDDFIIVVTDNAAFTVSIPTNVPLTGRTKCITVTIQNSAGGAHGAITWANGAGGYRLGGALAAIANGQQRSLIFRWNETASLWQEIARTAADVANA